MQKRCVQRELIQHLESFSAKEALFNNIQPKQTLGSWGGFVLRLTLPKPKNNHNSLQNTGGIIGFHEVRQVLKEQQNTHEESHAKETVDVSFVSAVHTDTTRKDETLTELCWTKIHKQIRLTWEFCHITCIVRAMANEEAPRENNR